jgi:hypothetical protein
MNMGNTWIDTDEAIVLKNEAEEYFKEDFTFVKSLFDATIFESGSDKLNFYTDHLKSNGTKYTKHVVSCASWAMDEDI